MLETFTVLYSATLYIYFHPLKSYAIILLDIKIEAAKNCQEYFFLA